MPRFKGEVGAGPRREIFYFDDNAGLNAIRYNDWKVQFSWIEGNLFSGKRTSANVPLVVNLRADPFERAPFVRADPFERAPFESELYRRWQAEKLWTLVPAQAVVGQFVQSFREYPPSQRSGSFNLDTVMEQLSNGAVGPGK